AVLLKNDNNVLDFSIAENRVSNAVAPFGRRWLRIHNAGTARRSLRYASRRGRLRARRQSKERRKGKL
ncbi:MAG TPA: hypothetical protein VKE42_04830, partial [Candidatus Cybelea sp.]|nr:hypothetical protein [Candidatus Cybelea sp.]